MQGETDSFDFTGSVFIDADVQTESPEDPEHHTEITQPQNVSEVPPLETGKSGDIRKRYRRKNRKQRYRSPSSSASCLSSSDRSNDSRSTSSGLARSQGELILNSHAQAQFFTCSKYLTGRRNVFNKENRAERTCAKND